LDPPHTSVGAHAVPHAPQWSGSAERSAHALPHAVKGAVQLATHAPL
jgi:hypothetical protein